MRLPPAARPLVRAATALLPLSLVACKGDDGGEGDDSQGGSAEACGDVDGDGGDSGDVPNILGSWTVTAGTNVYDDGFCSVPGLEATDLSSWMTGAMTITGYPPDRLKAHFDLDDTYEFEGVESARGGVAFAGDRDWLGHRLYVSFGGLLYRQPQVDTDEIRGFAYIGVDKDGADTVIDCWLQADFKAFR
jgi:hypothetical protein